MSMMRKYLANRAANRERRLVLDTVAELRGDDRTNSPAVLTNKTKMLGVLMLDRGRLGFDYSNAEGHVWAQGDPYLNLVIPPLPAEELVLGALRESDKLVAEYVARHGLVHTNLKAIGGMTNANLGRVAHRVMGYEIADLAEGQVPQEQLEAAQGIYETFTTSHKPFEPAFIYLTPKALLARYIDDPEIGHLASNPPLPNYDVLPDFDYERPRGI
jgi:hypothetical protein